MVFCRFSLLRFMSFSFCISFNSFASGLASLYGN